MVRSHLSVTDLDGDNRSMVLDMEFSAGNFEPGQHAVYVRAVDSAGNEVSKNVVFRRRPVPPASRRHHLMQLR